MWYDIIHACSVTTERPPVLCERPDPIADLLQFFMRSRSFSRWPVKLMQGWKWKKSVPVSLQFRMLCWISSSGCPSPSRVGTDCFSCLSLFFVRNGWHETKGERGNKEGKNRTCIPLANRVPHTHTHIYIYFALGPIDLPRYTFTLWVRQVIEPAQPSLPGWPLRPQGESLCRASDGWGLETTGGQSTLQRCARRRCNLGWSWILVRWTKDKILIWMKGYEAGFGSTCDTWGCKHCWQKADKGRKQQGWRMVLSGKYEWIWTRQTSIWILLGWWPEKPWCHSHHWTPKKSAVVLGQDSGQFLSKSFSSSTESRVLHGVPYQSNIAYSWISCLKM